MATAGGILQPLVPTDETPLQDRQQTGVVLPVPGNFAVGNSDIVSLNAEAKRSSEGLKMHQDTTGVLDKIQEYSKQSTDLGHHLLATLAAFNGNFGPAIALHEQKRNSKLIAQLTPALAKANELANSGRLQESAEFLQTVSANIAERAPQAQKVIQAAVEKIQAKQYAFEQLKTYADLKDKTTPKDHPNRSIVDAIKIAAKSNMPFSIDMLKEIMAEARPNVTVQDGVTQITSPSTGITLSRPTEKFFDIKSVPEIAKNQLIKETGMLESDVANILQGPDTPQKLKLQQRLAVLQGEEAERAITSKVPVTPNYGESVIAELQKKYPDKGNAEIRNMAARGDFGADVHVAAQEGVQRYAERAKAAEIISRNKYDPFAAATAGQDAVNLNPKSPNYLQVLGPMTHDDLLKNSDLGYLDKKITPLVVNSHQAITGLNKVKAFYDILSTENIDGTLTFDRLPAQIQRRLETATSIGFDATSAPAKALEVIANRAIEEVASTAKIDDATVKQLKEQVTGWGANPQGALKAVTEMQSRLQERLDSYVKQNRTTVGEGTVSVPFKQAIRATEGTPDGRESHKGAVGEYQILLDTGRPYLRQLKLPETKEALRENSEKVFDLLAADLQSKYPGRYDLQAAAYFSGEGNVKNGQVVDWTKHDGTAERPGTTVRQYVDRVMKRIDDQQAASKLVGATQPAQPTAEPTAQKSQSPSVAEPTATQPKVPRASGPLQPNFGKAS